MTALGDLELPAFDYLNPELRGPAFHTAMADLAEQGWLATMPLGAIAVDRPARTRWRIEARFRAGLSVSRITSIPTI